MELLKSSFDLDDNSASPALLMSLAASFDTEDGDSSEIVFDGRQISSDESKEKVKKALNDYINERVNVVAHDYKVYQASLD